MLTDSEFSVLRAVLVHGPISRRDLGERLALSAPSLTRLTKPHLGSGFLVEREDPQGGAVGRPSRPLDVPAGWGTFVGVKLTGEEMHVVVTDGRARVLRERVEPLVDSSPSAVLAQVARCVTALAGGSLTALGVAIGGVVEGGVAVDAPFLGWRDVDVEAELTRRLGVRVVVDNDLLALAEAERWSGAAREQSDFVLLTIGAGIGYGMVVDGRVLRTRDASIGLAGHVPVLADGPPCERGHRGCADSVLTNSAIADGVSGVLGAEVSYPEVMRLAGEGDPRVRSAVERVATALGTFIGLAASLSMQSTVVLAGDGLDLWDLCESTVRESAATRRDPRSEPLQIVADFTGFTAWARGAAVVAIDASVRRLSDSVAP